MLNIFLFFYPLYAFSVILDEIISKYQKGIIKAKMWSIYHKFSNKTKILQIIPHRNIVADFINQRFVAFPSVNSILKNATIQ